MRFRGWRIIALLAVTIGIVPSYTSATAQAARDAEFARLMAQGRSAFSAGKYQDAQQSIEQALELARGSAAVADEAAALLALADVHFVGSRYTETKATSLRCIASTQEAIRESSESSAWTMCASIVMGSLGEPYSSRPWCASTRWA